MPSTSLDSAPNTKPLEADSNTRLLMDARNSHFSDHGTIFDRWIDCSEKTAKEALQGITVAHTYNLPVTLVGEKRSSQNGGDEDLQWWARIASSRTKTIPAPVMYSTAYGDSQSPGGYTVVTWRDREWSGYTVSLMASNYWQLMEGKDLPSEISKALANDKLPKAWFVVSDNRTLYESLTPHIESWSNDQRHSLVPPWLAFEPERSVQIPLSGSVYFSSKEDEEGKQVPDKSGASVPVSLTVTLRLQVERAPPSSQATSRADTVLHWKGGRMSKVLERLISSVRPRHE